MPLTSSVMGQMMARIDFVTFTAFKKSQDLVEKKAQKYSMHFKQVQRFI